MGEIHYSSEKKQSAKDIAEVFKKSGIKRPAEDLDRIQRMAENADFLITAWSGDKMVGVARGITDYSYCCYLSDLAVDLDYQKHGIGTELVRRVQETIGPQCSLVLLSAPGAVDYYPKLGFVKNDRAFVIARES